MFLSSWPRRGFQGLRRTQLRSWVSRWSRGYYTLRNALNKHKGSKLGLLKIDFRNTFNLIKRTHFVKSACEMFPAMSSWTEWCSGDSSILLYDHEFIIASSDGVQQGDPLGPLYFCCGIMALVITIQATPSTTNGTWMMGDVELLKKLWV